MVRTPLRGLGIGGPSQGSSAMTNNPKRHGLSVSGVGSAALQGPLEHPAASPCENQQVEGFRASGFLRVCLVG